MNAVFGMFENTVTETVTAEIISLPATGQRRGRPVMAGFFVTQIKCLPSLIGNRIIFPRGEPEFVCVGIPGVGLPAFADDGSECGVCQNVDPGGGCRDLFRKVNDVFLAIFGITAYPVIQQFVVENRSCRLWQGYIGTGGM